MNLDNLLSIKQVAEYLGVNEITVRKLLKDGKIASYKVGGKNIRIERQELHEFMERCKQK